MLDPMLVLLHSPLVGPGTWQPVAAELRTLGHEVVTPPLDGLAEADAPYHQWLADRVLRVIGPIDKRRRVVLVGHSGAGALLPIVSAGLTGGAHRAVFVDAVLPRPGLSWFEDAPAELGGRLRELAVNGRLPPWNRWFPPESIVALLPDERQRAEFVAELGPLPLAYFEEPAPVVDGWPPDHCGYLQLSEAYRSEADEAERHGWTTLREPADHLAPLTQPQRIATLLDGLVSAMR